MKRTLDNLAHPVVIFAVALIAVNDLWLKAAYPSWVTGKLSDVGAMVVAPLLLAGLLSLLLPRKAAGWLALAAVGGGFALLKLGLLPVAQALPIRSVVDPTDLLALPFLAIPAWLWNREAEARPVECWKWLLVPLAMLTLLGDAAMPNYGVSCLNTKGQAIYAYSSYMEYYVSLDGGLSWQPASLATLDEYCNTPQRGQQEIFEGGDGKTVYRVIWNQSVELSTDGGQTWRMVALEKATSQPEETYLRLTRPGNLYFEVLPLDATLAPDSNDLVVAAGQEGALIVHPDTSWQAVPVGDYKPDRLKTAGLGGYTVILTASFVWTLLAGLVWLGAAGLRKWRKWWLVMVVVTLLVLAASLVALHPELSTNAYTGSITALALLATGILGLVLFIGAAVRLKWGLLRKVPLALLLDVVVFIPFVLWALVILPEFTWAQGISGVLLALAIAFIP